MSMQEKSFNPGQLQHQNQIAWFIMADAIHSSKGNNGKQSRSRYYYIFTFYFNIQFLALQIT